MRSRPLFIELATLLVALFVAGSPAARAELVLGLAADSPALGRPVPYALYRPPPALAPAGRRLPVLYLLHGLGDDERAWPMLGRVGETLDALIGAGEIAPLIVAMPAAGRSWYVDNPDPGGFGLMARALSQDLVSHVDAIHPTLPCRAGRAIGGLSMGGYGALLFVMDHPRRYAAAFSFSGSLFLPMPEDEGERAKRVTRMFGPAFGTPFDWQRFNRWNLFYKLPAYAADAQRTPIYLAFGDNDFPGLRAGNIGFHRALGEAGVAAPFRIDPGAHNWSLWAAQLGPALKWVDGYLAKSCPA